MRSTDLQVLLPLLCEEGLDDRLVLLDGGAVHAVLREQVVEAAEPRLQVRGAGGAAAKAAAGMGVCQRRGVDVPVRRLCKCCVCA